MNIVEFSIKQRVLVNIFMIGLFVAGVLCVLKLRREVFESISTDAIIVQTIDTTFNAPSDVERLITVPIEDELQDIEEIKEMISISVPNSSMIYLELRDNVKDIQTVLNDVRQEVDQAKADLPKSSEPPVTTELKFPFPVIIVGMTYEPGTDKLAIKQLADELQDEFESLAGVASVAVAGLNDREIWVEIDPYRAQSFGLSLAQIGEAIKSKNVDIPSGKLEGKSGELTLRVLEQIDEKTWKDLEDVVIKRAEGQTIRVRDVATIKNTFEKDTTLGRVNANPAITFIINKQKTGDTIAIADNAKKVINKMQQRLPDDVQLSCIFDTSKFVKTRLKTMIRNGILSLLLVGLLVYLFMSGRIALLVMTGLLVSFFGTFIYLVLVGNSFNMISLFSLILVLGMLVDDAIVVCENVYRHMENGMPPHKAAVIGTKEVIWPVIGTVSTTIVAFLPLLLTTGLMGKFINIIPQIITVALLLSLVEAMFILPSHLADFVKPSDLEKHTFIEVQSHFSFFKKLSAILGNVVRSLRKKIDNFLKRVLEYYSFILKSALRRRGIVILFSALLFISAILLIKFGIIPFKLFYADYADRFTIMLETPAHYRLQDTSEAVLALEKDLLANMPTNEIAAVITTVGNRPEDELVSKQGNNQAHIIFDIDELNPNCRKPMPILNDLRKIVEKHKDFVIAKVDVEKGGPPVGKAVTIRISGKNFETLKEISEKYKKFMATIPGIADISDDFESGKMEVHITIDEGKAALTDCDVTSLGREIFSAFQGSEVSIFRWGNDEVTIRVKYAEEFTKSIEDIKNFRIVNRKGKQVPIGTVAKINRAPGFGSINRRNRKRVISVFADVDGEKITSKVANQKIRIFTEKQNFEKTYPGYSIEFGGEEKDTQESMHSMAIAGIIAFILIYAILAGILNSFVQPLLILSIIPLGFVGVVYGFMIFNIPIGFMALMGTIGLVGIIVNDSIVMVSFINNYRTDWQKRNGMDENVRPSVNRHLTKWIRWSSLMKCGILRFRPIMLTTVTTVAGMSTVAFTRSGQEQFIAPMALAIVCGLSIGSTVTLFITPCVYAILDDIVHYFFGEGELPPKISKLSSGGRH